MSIPDANAVTQLLSEARDGNQEALDQVFRLVYGELHRLAGVIGRDRASETLNATALVHEAYLKLLPSIDLEWNDRAHFLRVAGRAMRQVLADAAERRAARKRGGGMARLTLNDGVPQERTLAPEEILDLDRALNELGEMNERQAAVVECRFFAGLGVEETAAAVGASVASVSRDWRFARAWLTKRLRTET